jgi:hypothetical protein
VFNLPNNINFITIDDRFDILWKTYDR